jgi:hypothetical protein
MSDSLKRYIVGVVICAAVGWYIKRRWGLG